MKETTLSMNANKAWERFMEKFSNAPEKSLCLYPGNVQ